MKTIIKIDDLNDTIIKDLRDFGDDVIEAQKKAVDEETKEAHEVLKKNAPVKTGRYKKSLKKKKSFENLTEKRMTLYSEKSGLPHLLERPHATRNGKRTKGHPHFAIAEEHVKNNLEKTIEKNIESLK